MLKKKFFSICSLVMRIEIDIFFLKKGKTLKKTFYKMICIWNLCYQRLIQTQYPWPFHTVCCDLYGPYHIWIRDRLPFKQVLFTTSATSSPFLQHNVWFPPPHNHIIRPIINWGKVPWPTAVPMAQINACWLTEPVNQEAFANLICACYST